VFRGWVHSDLDEVAPVRVADLAEGCGSRYPFRDGRLTDEAKTNLRGETVPLYAIHAPFGPNEVLEGVPTTPGARDDVVQVAAFAADKLAGVLATTAVTSQTEALHSRGCFIGILENWVATITVGTRTLRVALEIVKSKVRTGSRIQSSH